MELEKLRSLPKVTQLVSHRAGVKPRSARPSNSWPQCFGMVGSWWEITADSRCPRNYLVQPPPLNSGEEAEVQKGEE